MIDELKHERYHQDIEDTKLTVDDLQGAGRRFKALVKERAGKQFPNSPWDQLMGAVGAVFGSWMNDRAIVYRRKYNIPTEWGTAVNVQAMVYGNTGDDSGSGVAFTRNPANGVEGVLRRVPDQRAGRGRRRRRAHAGAGRRAEEADAEGLRRARAHPPDAREALQGRAGLRVHDRGRRRLHAADAQRQAHGDGGAEVLDGHVQGEADRLEDGGDAQSRPISSSSCSRRCSTSPKSPRRRRSPPACRPARARRPGKIYLNADRAVAAAEKGEKVLLVRVETSPEDLRGMIAAEGILTARGGVSSHAALVARQMGKVCVCGAAAVEVDYQARTVTVDGQTFKEGDWMSIDGTAGKVYAGQVKTAPSEIVAGLINGDEAAKKTEKFKNFQQLMKWCAEATRMSVRTNADTPEQTANAVAFGAVGIGLMPHRAHVLRGRPHRRDARDDPGRDARGARRRRWPSCCRTSARTSPASSGR